MIDWGYLLELLGIILAIWLTLAAALSVLLGRGIRMADEREGHVRPRRVGQWWCPTCRAWVRQGHGEDDESPAPTGGPGSRPA